jgi:hypothetical protein
MFKPYEGMETWIRTRTDLLVLIPDAGDGEATFSKQLEFSVHGKMLVKIGRMFSVPTLAVLGEVVVDDAVERPVVSPLARGSRASAPSLGEDPLHLFGQQCARFLRGFLGQEPDPGPAPSRTRSPLDVLKAAGLPETLSILPWEVTAMEASGTLPGGDPVKVTNVEGRTSSGIIRQRVKDQPFPADLEADVCAQIMMESTGTTLSLVTPVLVKARVEAIPPFGVEAVHCGSRALADSAGNLRGMLVGKSITLLGPA